MPGHRNSIEWSEAKGKWLEAQVQSRIDASRFKDFNDFAKKVAWIKKFAPGEAPDEKQEPTAAQIKSAIQQLSRFYRGGDESHRSMGPDWLRCVAAALEIEVGVLRNAGAYGTEASHAHTGPTTHAHLHSTSEKLLHELRLYQKSLNDDNLVERYLSRECVRLMGSLEELEREKHTTKVKTLLLYETILESIEKFEQVDIIDQDVTRWNELLRSDFHIGCTFNYSDLILYKTIKKAKDNEQYRLRRIFALSEDEDIIKRGPQTLRILDEISRETSKTDGRIESRFVILPSSPKREEKELQYDLEEAEDVVIVKSKTGDAILREHVTCLQRRSAAKSESEISIQQEDVREARRIFDKLWRVAEPISELKKRMAGKASKRKARQ